MSLSELTIAIETLEHAGRTVKLIKCTGAADATNVEGIDKVILEQIESLPALDMVLDGAGLTYINSTFIGHLTDWYSRLEAKQGKFLLVNLQEQPLDTLGVVGILTIIPHYLTLDEAKLALSSTAGTAMPPAATPRASTDAVPAAGAAVPAPVAVPLG